MKRFSIVTAIAAVALLASLAAAAAQTAQVQTAPQTAQPAQRLHKRSPHVSPRTYDGLWSVAIYTQYGPCDPTYRYPVRIIGGRIMQADNDFSYQITGAVAGSGAIAVTVYRGGQSATGYGRLRGSSGAGRWSTGGNMCYGTWGATRRTAAN